MNKSERRGAFFALLLLCVTYLANGQGISKEREYSGFFDSYYYRGPLSFTGGLGTSLPTGDLIKGLYGNPGLALSVGANYKLWPRTALGAEFQYLTLSGKSVDSLGLSYTGSDWGLNVYGRLYFIDDIIRKAQDRRTDKKFKAYLTSGIGFIRYKAVVSPAGGASGLAPVFPLGLGLEFKLSPRIQLLPEFTHTFTLTDRLDGAALEKGPDGYSQLVIKIQFSPFAPKKKKKLVLAPVDPNLKREEHQEWRKKKEVPKPPVEEEFHEEENTEEEKTEEGTEENLDAPKEEGTPENTDEKSTGE